MTVFWKAHLQPRLAFSQIATWDTSAYNPESEVFLSSTDTDTLRKIDWYNMSFNTHHIVQCISVTNKGR